MIQSNLSRIQTEVAAAARGRPVKIIGASKTVDADRMREAYESGLLCFGENRIQEAIPKIQQLPDDIEWHFIGHLQSNKVRDAVKNFSWIQSVDSLPLLRKIDQESFKQQKPLSVLIEMNLGAEDTKHGLNPKELKDFMAAASGLQLVKVRGLMAIPPFFENPQQVRPYFRRLRELAAEYEPLKELSMGMSHDYMVAIEEGATIVRIGTALFGERASKKL